ncbi:MAG: SpoVR family protein [Micavibrio aeruginosavorus]|nr:SpoVR family protein [Micavibrio aeruginosavorus]
MSEEKKDYKQQIFDLLDNYEDGRNLFKKAEDWTYPVLLKPGAEDKGLPESWLGLADEVIRIIAHEKYGLDTYRNKIEIITADQMLDAYTSVGMPVSYNHWSFGKARALQGDAYKKGQMGLAYEIVINTNPAIAYCMEENTKTMQMLVIAHASYGHNSFFKGNHLFRQFTDADHILEDLKTLKTHIEECEERYGVEEVEKLIDACHALKSHGVDRRPKPPRRSAAEMRQRQEAADEFKQRNLDPLLDNIIYPPRPADSGLSNSFNGVGDTLDEENLLMYIAENAPHLAGWQRDIVARISHVEQYFYPQRQTQLTNEGWATFWHHTILNDLYHDVGLIDEGMWMEFTHSHTSVIAQPNFDSPYFSGNYNPYALGFAMYTDLKRICQNPTDEDREYFPDIAGNPDWVSVLMDAMKNYKDESFVQQFLSPKVMRDFRMFVIKDDDKEDTIEVSAIHNEDGFRQLRRDLAAQYNLGNREPRIEVGHYNARSDRSVILYHTMHNRRPLEERNMQEVLKHFYQLWSGGGDKTGGHRVILHSIDENRNIVKSLACPAMPKDTPKPGMRP